MRNVHFGLAGFGVWDGGVGVMLFIHSICYSFTVLGKDALYALSCFAAYAVKAGLVSGLAPFPLPAPLPANTGHSMVSIVVCGPHQIVYGFYGIVDDIYDFIV